MYVVSHIKNTLANTSYLKNWVLVTQMIWHFNPCHFSRMMCPKKTKEPKDWKKFLGVFWEVCKVLKDVAAMIKAVKDLFF